MEKGQYRCGYCHYFIAVECEDLMDHKCFSPYKNRITHLEEDSGVLMMVFKEPEPKKVSNKLLCVTSQSSDNPFPLQPPSTASKSSFQSKNCLQTPFVSSASVPKANIPFSLPSPSPTASTSTLLEEDLIQLVLDRPALYDISLPVVERTNLKKNQLWTEIAELLGVGVEDARRKWKYLRDCYAKAKKSVTQYIPSGSACQERKDPGFRFYNQMRFLDDSTERQPTITSVSLPATPSPTLSNFSGSGLGTPQGPLSPPPKKKKVDENKELQKGILEALSAPTPAPDGVDGFLLRLGESLRKMPYRTRAQLEIKIMQLVLDTEENL